LAPFAGGQAIVDVLADVPVEFDEFLIGGGEDFLLG
jgi:hypothetical protein